MHVTVCLHMQTNSLLYVLPTPTQTNQPKLTLKGSTRLYFYYTIFFFYLFTLYYQSSPYLSILYYQSSTYCLLSACLLLLPFLFTYKTEARYL